MNDRSEPYKIRLKEGGLLLNKEKQKTKKGILHNTHTKRLWSKTQIQN